eukprot:376173_1
MNPLLYSYLQVAVQHQQQLVEANHDHMNQYTMNKCNKTQLQVNKINYYNFRRLQFPSLNMSHQLQSNVMANAPRHSTIYNKYIVMNRIAMGTFGDILGVIDKETRTAYAVKKLKRDTSLNADMKRKRELSLLHEAQTLLKLNAMSDKSKGNHCIIKCHQILYAQHASVGPCIVLELCGYSLLNYIQHYKAMNMKISFATIRIIGQQILSAMRFLHGVGGIIHTDLKPE